MGVMLRSLFFRPSVLNRDPDSSLKFRSDNFALVHFLLQRITRSRLAMRLKQKKFLKTPGLIYGLAYSSDLVSQCHGTTMPRRFKPHEVSQALGLLVAALGAFVLFGWVIDVDAIKRVLPGAVSMKANAALGFIGAGVGIIAAGRTVRWLPPVVATIMGWILVALGTATVSQDLTAIHLGIDEILVVDNTSGPDTGAPGRMAPNTALALCLTGLALILGNTTASSSWRATEWLAITIGLLGLMGIIGYVFRESEFYRLGAYTAMAFHTAIAFIVVSVALSLTRPWYGLAALLYGNSPVGVRLRNLLPVALFVPLLLGWLALTAYMQGWLGWVNPLAATILLTSTVMTIVIFRAAQSANVADEDRTRAMLELSQRSTELERSNEALDEFAYIASHDLREPLRGIYNYVNFVLEDHGDELPGDSRERLETVVKLCQQLDVQIESLLRYSRVGRAEEAIQFIAVEELLEEVRARVEPMLAETGGELHIQDSLPRLACDASRLREVLYNLVINALKYNNNASKQVEVGCVPPTSIDLPESASHVATADSVVLFVKDNGIGIAEKNLEKVFQMFRRLHAGDKYGGGTGAGLAIVKRIVERMGGAIWANSAIGNGSTFYVLLPKTPKDQRS